VYSISVRKAYTWKTDSEMELLKCFVGKKARAGGGGEARISD
jgi:hypothetical protein